MKKIAKVTIELEYAVPLTIDTMPNMFDTNIVKKKLSEEQRSNLLQAQIVLDLKTLGEFNYSKAGVQLKAGNIKEVKL